MHKVSIFHCGYLHSIGLLCASNSHQVLLATRIPACSRDHSELFHMPQEPTSYWKTRIDYRIGYGVMDKNIFTDETRRGPLNHIFLYVTWEMIAAFS